MKRKFISIMLSLSVLFSTISTGYASNVDENDEMYPNFIGEEYLEGYVPQDWGKQEFGISLHNVMFPSLSEYQIVDWT